ncbi:hypothetical protein DP43_2357 [Burkholderia pseudomallei]|nr:hypothetical protein DP43_2357 [Burkholderia pseudomallei]
MNAWVGITRGEPTACRIGRIGDRRPATGDRRPATGDRRPATGDRRPATGDRRPATGDRHTRACQPPTANRQPWPAPARRHRHEKSGAPRRFDQLFISRFCRPTLMMSPTAMPSVVSAVPP